MLDLLNLTPAEQTFRAQVREFLAAELTPDIRAATASATSVFVDRDVALAWQRKLHARGWLVPSWPTQYGGVEWSPMERYIFESEAAAAGAPMLIPMGLSMVAHVIIKFGTEAQKHFYLPRILSGEDYWCQGYSEPGSGSDLASLRCRAESDGDDYVVNGSKIWTTHAHFANRIFCLVRTSTEGKPQAGISFLLVDMNTPGITVQPIITLGGDHEVNQVFLDNVRVPKANRVGAEGQGWSCAKYLLEFERGGGVHSPRLRRSLAFLKNIARRQPDGHGGCMADVQWVRRRIAELEVDLTSMEFAEIVMLTSRSQSEAPGPQSSVQKTEATEFQQAVSELALELLGPLGIFFESSEARRHELDAAIGFDNAASIAPRYCSERAASIYGGANEIQRNIIARNVLGI